MKIAERLKQLRTAKNLSIREVSNRLGIPVSTYRDWEYGKAIRGEPYEKIAKLFEVTLEDLLLENPKGPSEILARLLEAQEKIEAAIRDAKSI